MKTISWALISVQRSNCCASWQPEAERNEISQWRKCRRVHVYVFWGFIFSRNDRFTVTNNELLGWSYIKAANPVLYNGHVRNLKELFTQAEEPSVGWVSNDVILHISCLVDVRLHNIEQNIEPCVDPLMSRFNI